MMFLDVSKKPGTPDAVKTADEIVAENIHLRDLVQRLAQRLQMARLEGFGGPEREKFLDEAREAIGEAAHLRNSNAAALRKALEDTEELLEHFAKPGTMLHNAFFLHMRDNRAALAAPPRNCDVGTLTEQQQRFHDFCEKMQHTDKACCGGCPIVHLRMQGVINNSCELAWAQMPYKEGSAE